MDEDVRKFVGHAWLDEHNDTYFVVELDVADLKEKQSRFSTIMEKEGDILEIESLASDPTEISQESAEKALGLVGDQWETGVLVEYEGEDLEELEYGDEDCHALRYGRVRFSGWLNNGREYIEYICFPKHWDGKACTLLYLK